MARRPVELQNLLAIVSRQGRWGPRSGLYDLEQLVSEFEGLREAKDWIIRQQGERLVVKAVTCMEVFLRSTLAEMIDHGEEFQERAAQLGKDLKFDFQLIRALQGRSVSLGLILSHSVSLNNVEAVISALTVMVGDSLKERLSSIRDRWEVEVKGNADEPIIENLDVVLRDVGDVFNIRHIIVHELPHDSPVKVDKIERQIQSCSTFVRAVDAVVQELMFPGSPLTQADMNVFAAQSFQSANKELESMLAQLRRTIGEEAAQELETANEAWVTFRDAQANFCAAQYKGGSIAPMIRAAELERVTRERITYFRKVIDEYEML